MESLFVPEWAPNIHPLIVHFPIALLVTAGLANLISLFIPEKWWDEAKNTILYVLGGIAAIVAYYTGQAAADTVFLETEAQSVLTEHADWALWLVWFFGLYILLRIAFHWFSLFEKRSFKVIAFLTVLPGLFMIYETAEYGGKMVFGYGAGTGQLIQPEEPVSEQTSSNPDTSAIASPFIENENGGWSWQINETSVSDLISNFHWIEGSVQELRPKVRQGNLNLEASEDPNFFVTNENSQNVQLDAYLNIEDLTGEIRLVHHVQDTHNYDFVSLNSDGTIRQGRIQDGEATLFEEGFFEPQGTLYLRVVADDTHFRGYIDREMKVHGHGDAPAAGAVGLRLEGSGSVQISSIELTPLN
ncbi:MAG: hypothetical protein LC655_00710 [Bacteroidales bacterium]|nr:hypothetical protein [Bacteroidales bacterium]